MVLSLESMILMRATKTMRGVRQSSKASNFLPSCENLYQQCNQCNNIYMEEALDERPTSTIQVPRATIQIVRTVIHATPKGFRLDGQGQFCCTWMSVFCF